MVSSYIKNNFDLVLKAICFIQKPKKIVEFGILDGFSLNCFAESCDRDTIIEAYDLFEDFPYNSSDYNKTLNTFSIYNNVIIHKANFYNQYLNFEKESIDILHIDIANDGNVYEFALNNYMEKISKNGIMILEGGSEERDEYDWMIKYKKRKINPFLKSINDKFNIKIIDKFPSMTIIKKNYD